jgi:hypothetical protein
MQGPEGQDGIKTQAEGGRPCEVRRLLLARVPAFG